MSFRFSQVDVFSAEPLRGNPVAVVHEAVGLTAEQMQAFAAWTNLSETTFLLPATSPDADYRVRIFTPGGELPFAGHPTLGSAHAWLESGGTPRGGPDTVVQECGVGLVTLRRSAGRLAFRAPELLRSGPVSEEDLTAVAASLGIGRGDIVDSQWIDNGPGWVGVRLADAAAVLEVQPDASAMGDYKIGVLGVYPEGGESDGDCAVEVRAFAGGLGVVEDPVTGSLNAGIGQWLAGRVLPASYVASQGTVLGRRGRVRVDRVDDQVWVGGDTRTTITGTVDV